MFCGLVTAVGRVQDVKRQGPDALRLSFGLDEAAWLEGVGLGDSVAVNGCCLTVVHLDASSFAVDAMPETLRATNLGAMRVGARVNLELALRVGDRLGGHWVTGHVDGGGRLLGIRPEANAVRMDIGLEAALLRYMVPKGSIALDGISLTVFSVDVDRIGVSLIPHTMANTALPYRQIGDRLNVEVDILGKYVERLLGQAPPTTPGGIQLPFLQRHGFLP